eukprot:COSAG02_NODE_4992_length_4742_cov_8.191040_1_plen_65_part_00
MPECTRKLARVRALQAMEIYCRLNGSHFPGWDRFMGMCNTAYYDVHWNDGFKRNKWYISNHSLK